MLICQHNGTPVLILGHCTTYLLPADLKGYFAMRLIAIATAFALMSIFVPQEAQATPGKDVAGYSSQELTDSFERVTRAVENGTPVSDPLDTKILESVYSIASQAAPLVDRDIDQADLATGNRHAPSPAIGGGKDKYGYYVVFSAFEQDLVINGWGWMLSAAICAIPAVGSVLCAVVTAVFIVITTYASQRKTCKGRPAKVYPGIAGQRERMVCL